MSELTVWTWHTPTGLKNSKQNNRIRLLKNVLSLSKKEDIEPWWNYCSTITVYDWQIIIQTHFWWFTYIFVISRTKNMVCKCLPKISQNKKHCEIINCPLHFLKVKTFWLFATYLIFHLTKLGEVENISGNKNYKYCLLSPHYMSKFTKK